MQDNTIYVGNVLDVIRTLPSDYFDCIVTSPPYYSQRFYGEELNTMWDGIAGCIHEWDEFIRPSNCWSTPGPGLYSGKGEYNKAWVKPQKQAFCRKCGAWYGQLGLEPTPNLYIRHLVSIFSEVRRVLKPTGLFFLNIGDTYAGSKQGYGLKNKNPKTVQDVSQGFYASSVMNPPSATCVGSEDWIKPKQLLLVPSRLVIELQYDGWILRKDIIWKKKSCLPTQVRDNFNSVYEHIFMLAKSPKYYFNHKNARKPYEASSLRRQRYRQSVFGGDVTGAKSLGATKSKLPQVLVSPNPDGAIIGDVWEIGTSNFHGEHFATYSEELVLKCLSVGVSHEVCSKCGKPKMERMKWIVREWNDIPEAERAKFDRILSRLSEVEKERIVKKMQRKKISDGWYPTCNCNVPFIPGVMLDPFSGSGTSCIVAKKLGFRYVGIDMKKEYADMALKRLSSMLS